MTGLWLAAFALVLAFAMIWAFRVLPREEWQFIASVPRKKDSAGSWTAVNLTYYGFFTATAYLLAAVVFLLLAGSVGISILQSLALLAIVFVLCVPAARWIALYIDKTKSGFTVAGATFVGLLALPAAIYLMNLATDRTIPYTATFAAASIAYCFGESIGRFACISFGCCYGKPLTDVHPPAARIFHRLHFVFYGRNKKIAYAAGLEGVKVVPIQALTAILYSLIALIGIAFFLHSYFRAAFVLTIAGSQIWRVYSETLRADYRGEGRITAYQTMALLAVPIAVLIAWMTPTISVAPDLSAAMTGFANPLTVLFLQATWAALFWYTGISDTTRSVISFHVAPEFQQQRDRNPLTKS